MHFIVTIYTIFSKISKIRQKFKNSPIVKQACQLTWRSWLSKYIQVQHSIVRFILHNLCKTVKNITLKNVLVK